MDKRPIGRSREVTSWTTRLARLSRVFWHEGVGAAEDQPTVPAFRADVVGPARASTYHPDYARLNWRGWWDWPGFRWGGICHYLTLSSEALQLELHTTVRAAVQQVN